MSNLLCVSRSGMAHYPQSLSHLSAWLCERVRKLKDSSVVVFKSSCVLSWVTQLGCKSQQRLPSEPIIPWRSCCPDPCLVCSDWWGHRLTLVWGVQFGGFFFCCSLEIVHWRCRSDHLLNQHLVDTDTVGGQLSDLIIVTWSMNWSFRVYHQDGNGSLQLEKYEKCISFPQ